MLKTGILGLVVLILVVYLLINRHENFNENQKITDLRNTVNGISNRVRRLEDIENNFYLIREGLEDFNLDVMNDALEELQDESERERDRLEDRVERKLRDSIDDLSDSLSERMDEIEKLFGNKIDDYKKSEEKKFILEDEKIKNVDKQVGLLINALDKIKDKELSDFKIIQNELKKIQKNKTISSKNMMYLISGGVGLFLLILLVVLLVKK